MTEMLMQDAMRLRRAGRLDEAAALYGEILRGDPRHFEALHALGILRYQKGQLEEAERLIGEATRVKPNSPDASYNRACLLQKLNRLEDALVAFDAAIALKPGYIEALTNRGTASMALKRYEAALADFDRVVALRPELAQAWNNRAGALLLLKRHVEAISSCEKALAVNPHFPDAWRSRGNALFGARDYVGALESASKAVALDPRNAEAWECRANALAELGRREEAVSDYGRALSLRPGRADALYNRASTLLVLRRFEEAARDFGAVLALDPEYPNAPGGLVFSKLCRADWRDIDREIDAARAALREGKPAAAPFMAVAFARNSRDVLTAARLWTQRDYPEPPPLWRGERYAHGKIRVAYLSADFRAHPVSFLLAPVFEHHDRARFETTAISFAPDDHSGVRARIAGAVDHFIDMAGKSDVEIATLLREKEIDIAVDLMGFTEGCRPAIFAQRPAPVQVNYLGFPATMGANFIDYFVADTIVVPETQRKDYSEQVVYLPGSYLPNHVARAARTPTRTEAGLPESGFVFCAFNNSYKFMPSLFDLWMRLLKATPGSVLWLSQSAAAAAVNLAREADARDVSADRLIFAPHVPSEDDHLARLRLADLLLDTAPYNAHATACHALAAGVPVVSVPGETFASRVAASLLYAAGLPELVTDSLSAYEALAFNLAHDRAALAALKAKLADGQRTQPLFDTARYTRNLEAAYAAMRERSERREKPSSFAVQNAARSP